MSLYGQDGSIYDSQQLEKVYFLFVICTSIYLFDYNLKIIYSMVMLILENLLVQIRLKIVTQLLLVAIPLVQEMV